MNKIEREILALYIFLDFLHLPEIKKKYSELTFLFIRADVYLDIYELKSKLK